MRISDWSSDVCSSDLMAKAIVAAVTACNDSDTIRCVIVTGAGPKAFCAGSDISELDSYATPWDFRNRSDYCDAIHRLLKPTIEAVNGYAPGGGLETALSWDIRTASSKERKRVGLGKRVSGRVELGGGRVYKTKKRMTKRQAL